MAMEGNSSSSSCSAANKKVMTKKDEERLSCLHEPLIYHILSFLDMKEVVQTSILSKRWRNIWRSVRILNFHEYAWTNDGTLDINKRKLKFFIDTVLLLRDGSDIDKFDLNFCTHCGDCGRIDRWIAYAVKRRVQVLTLASVPISSPKSICLSGGVNTLDLAAIILPGDKNRNLSLDLPIVENLIIASCDHDGLNILRISGPKLKYLRLDNAFQDFNRGTSIKINAPNLISLKCNGYTYEDYTLENLSALVTADIDTMIDCDDEDLNEDEDEETTLKKLVGMRLSGILKGITNAKSLTLSGHGFQVCFLPLLLQ
ncbi:hypothetical protein IFM89_036741 [Coptis chinensis]|uniref:F-box domain-containing protein n=1 Tax=Coptis chinensis TaxID=261450 RepID=A0A835I5D6_9MAGN|nr:hypothetical protein IFM89_036741 [Coptis chinensis]